MAQHKARMDELRTQVHRRDEEIARLGKVCESGRDVERLHTEARIEANENIIVSLNQQVRSALYPCTVIARA